MTNLCCKYYNNLWISELPPFGHPSSFHLHSYMYFYLYYKNDQFFATVHRLSRRVPWKPLSSPFFTTPDLWTCAPLQKCSGWPDLFRPSFLLIGKQNKSVAKFLRLKCRHFLLSSSVSDKWGWTTRSFPKRARYDTFHCPGFKMKYLVHGFSLRLCLFWNLRVQIVSPLLLSEKWTVTRKFVLGVKWKIYSFYREKIRIIFGAIVLQQL